MTAEEKYQKHNHEQRCPCNFCRKYRIQSGIQEYIEKITGKASS